MADAPEARIAIAIDGPGSAGKGTIARAVARSLGYAYVDTGAMYRAVALFAGRAGLDLDAPDEDALTQLARRLQFAFGWDGDILQVEVDGEDVTRAIRSEEAGQGASRVSALPGVRQALLGLQRELASEGGVVMDGRDIGTVVLPEAELKIFLDAELEERARRRHEELVRRGEVVRFDAVLEDLRARDARDRSRDTAPLRPADDAVVIDTTDLTIRQVVDRVLALVAGR